MCLLVVVSGRGAGGGLLVAANRDERSDRPAVPITVLRESGPRVLGGQDLVAGGTWLAVNEHGVIAGLTNTPTEGGPDRTKRSRGALPLLAAGHRTAAEAAEALACVDPRQFNPAWILVADRRSGFAVTVAGDRPSVVALPPGVHVLENRPPGYGSAKVRHVLAVLGPVAEEPGGPPLRDRLATLLGDHTRPAGAEDDSRRPELLAPCVHADGYGTRSAALIEVPADPSRRPTMAVADGPPCRASLVDRSGLWDSAPVPGEAHRRCG